MKKLLAILLTALFVLGGMAMAEEPSGTLVIYSPHDASPLEAGVALFEATYPNIEVQVVAAGTGELLQRIKAESENPLCDVLWGGGADSLAAFKEYFQPYVCANDDVIDEADMRRGKPSANARWQSHKAVILGDYILAKNMNIGLQSGQFDLVTHVCGSMAALCEGEVLQDECAANSTMTRQAYLDIIYKKTASLLGVSASAGALAVGATRDRVATMRRFGEAVGMAFQIQDDILDYTPTAHTGKPANNDLREGKITLPLLSVLDRASDSRRRELLERLSRCHESDEEVEYLRSTVENEGGLSFAAEVMQGYIARAVEMLSDYPDSEYRSALVNLCAYIAERDR